MILSFYDMKIHQMSATRLELLTPASLHKNLAGR